MKEKQYFVYLLSNKHNGVIYTGVTGDLKKRVYEHKEKIADGFTKKYNVDKLVYYEVHESPVSAIDREKQIKAGRRREKVALINGINPQWQDLWSDL